MLGEDDQLLRGLVRIGRGRLGAERQDLSEQARELLPLGVPPAAPQAARDLLHVPQDADLGLQFGTRAGGRRLVEDLLDSLLLPVRRKVLQVFEVVSVHVDAHQCLAGSGLAAAAQQFQLPQTALQPFPPSSSAMKSWKSSSLPLCGVAVSSRR